MDKILGLNLNKLPKPAAKPKKADSIPSCIADLAAKRKAAKAAKDYTLADTLRKEIEAAGYIVTDIANGDYTVSPLQGS